MSAVAIAAISKSIWWKIGAFSGASAVLTGAFGAHALKNHTSDPKRIKTWETAAHYQLIHSVALLATPLCRRPNLVGSLLTIGTLGFSASLYALVILDKHALGAITPMGGICLVCGWLAMLL